MIEINGKYYNEPAGKSYPFWRYREDGHIGILPNTTRQNKRGHDKEWFTDLKTFFGLDIMHTKLIVNSNAQGRLEISRSGREDKTRTQFNTYVVEGTYSNNMYDHIDNDPYNCTYENQRPATHAQNACNKKMSKNNTSGFKGVHWSKRDNCYIVALRYQGITHSGSTYKTSIVGGLAYNEMARKYHGEFARLNEITVNDIIDTYMNLNYRTKLVRDLKVLDKHFNTNWSDIINNIKG